MRWNMTPRQLIFAWLLGLPSVPPITVAQVDTAGWSKVRVTTTSGERIVGFMRLGSDGILVLSPKGDSVRRAPLAPASIRELEISRGRTAGAGAVKGIKWGGIITGALAALVLFEAGHTPDQCTATSTGACHSVNNAGPLVELVAGGLFWGGVIGALVKAEDWQSVPVPTGRN